MAYFTEARATEAIASLNALITAVKTANTSEAAKLQAYSLAVEARQKAFYKDADSLTRLLSPIGSAVRSQYGAASKEATTIGELIVKIRGEKRKKDAQNPDAETVSRSERSFGSVTHNFADLSAVLGALTPPYNPANAAVKLAALTSKATLYNNVNTAVATAFGNLTKERKTRNDLYADLKERCARVKEAVKSQYGVHSTEYKLIKGLRI